MLSQRIHEQQLNPAGELDIGTANAVFDPQLFDTADVLTVNLSAVTFIDAFTLGKIVNLRNVTIGRGGTLLLTGASARTARVFELAGLASLL